MKAPEYHLSKMKSRKNPYAAKLKKALSVNVPITIETVTEKDPNDLKNIAQMAIIESVDAPKEMKNNIITDTFAHIEKGIVDQDCCYLKCVSSEAKITGFVLIQNYWNLSDLFVTPAMQGQGLGKMLLSAAINECQQSSNKNFIRVNSSKNAEGFYRYFGFKTYKPKNQLPDFVVPLVYKFKVS